MLAVRSRIGIEHTSGLAVAATYLFISSPQSNSFHCVYSRSISHA